jgi:O-acetyl-ADP-ribose deacetylase (regulator of RNase III)
MIELTHGDILRADTEAVVNTVNCVGFMGRGIAAQVKRAWPASFPPYAAACARGELVPGRMLVVPTGQMAGPRTIIHFPTRRHWRGKSRIEDIRQGLVALVTELRERKIQSVAIPPLGCGLGGLRWAEVLPLIEQALAALPDVRAVIYEPDPDAAPARLPITRDAPAMTPGRAVLLGLMDAYLAPVADPFITLLEVHKLMYLAQEAGEPLRLRFAKAPYGPYAENLRHVLMAVEGYFITGYGDGGDAPDKPLELVPGAREDAAAALRDHPDTLARFERVKALVDGFESAFGMELLATTHWVMAHEGAQGDEVVAAVHRWAPHKLRFRPGQIQIAAARIHELGWAAAR